MQDSKGKAREALDQAGEIKKLIEHAEERTREAENALAGAESDARIARDSAKQAQEHAEQASKVRNMTLNRFVKGYVLIINKMAGCRDDSTRSVGDQRQSWPVKRHGREPDI